MDVVGYRASALPPIDENLFAIHCSTGLPKDFPDGTQPVSVITVLSVFSGEKKSFASIWLAPELGVPTSEFKARHAELEKEVLSRFYAFAAQKPAALWLHCNMRSSQFGFDVFERRALALGVKPVPIGNRFDLYDLVARKLYPDPYFGHPRLEMMFRFNFGNVPDLLTDAEAEAAWAAGHYTALVRAAEAKVGCIAGLHAKLLRGEALRGNPRCRAGVELDRFAAAVLAAEAGEAEAARGDLADRLARHVAVAQAELKLPHPRGPVRAGVGELLIEATRRVDGLRADPSALTALGLWCRAEVPPVAEELKNDGTRRAQPNAEQQASVDRPAETPPSVPQGDGVDVQYVTLDQMAARVGRSKKTLERMMNADDSDMPHPDIEGGGGRPHEWLWSRIRPWLEQKFHRSLPERYPSLRPPP